MKKTQLAAAAAVLLVAAIAIYFAKKGGGSLQGTPSPAELERVVNTFHPDSVLGFQWKTKSKTSSFARKSRDDQWLPQVNPQDVQERLNLIAAADYQPLETKGKPLVEVTVAFGEKSQWSGAWDGTYFYWTSGNYENQGFQPKRNQVEKFEAGRLAFEAEKLDWCPQRIKTLEVEAGTLKYKLRQQGLKWIIDSKEVDPTFVEQWFGRACSNKLTEYLDPETAKPREITGTFKAEFADGKRIEWKKEPDGPAFNNGRETFLSPQLAGHLDELPKAPVLGDAPAAPAK
ncbi:MAG: hypothetical protein ABL958_09290 [Bdellovibrionia bacterium]